MVKCAECGFLALRHKDSFELVGAPDEYRSGIPVEPEGYDFRPVCFMRAADLWTAVNDTQEVVYGEWLRAHPYLGDFTERDDRMANLEWERTKQSSAKLVIAQERECSSYTAWKQGFTPKEHREMLDRQWLTEREDRRDQEMRAREDARDEAAERRHNQEMRALRGQHWRELWVFGGLIGLATVIAAALEGAISRGWQPPGWPF